MPDKSKWFSSILKRVKPLIAELATYSFFVNILALAIPIFVLQIYNRVVVYGNMSTLQGLLIGAILILVFDYILRQIRSNLLQKAAMRIEISLGEALIRKFWALPLRVLETRPSAYWQSVFRDVDVVRNTIAGPPFLLLIDLPFAVLFVALIFIIAEPIAWIFVTIAPIFVILAAVSGKLVSKANEKEKEKQKSRDLLVGDLILSRGTIKALSLDDGIAPHWEDVQSNNIESSVQRGWLQDSFANAGSVLTLASTVVITSFGAIAIINQELSIGALIAANMLSNRVIGPFSQLIGAWRNFSAYRVSRERLEQVMSLDTERIEQTIQMDRPKGEIKIENVSFGYVENTEPVLENLTTVFPANGVHMVMGPNGGGKSTLIKLIKGLYMPNTGRILIDGADISQFTRAQLSNWMGYVPQETILMNGTIRENICARRQFVPDERVIEVCRQVGIHNIITDFPDGYSTEVGEAGGAMSGGIRQRISIARALIDDPAILIFDEPSASLDRFAEINLGALLQKLSKSSTIIVVSHSPVLLGATKNLYLLDKKHIILSGPKEKVLKQLDGQQRPSSGSAQGSDNKESLPL
jgi:ATP-binding cassette, subfamily C, bacterial LapB